MKFSVVIPSYNSDALLLKSLQSLAKQVLEEGDDLEIIVIDDGSTDQTKEVVEEMAGHLKKLRYLYRMRDDLSNRSRARNLGIQQAAGDFICFLDSGILVPPRFLQRVSNYYKVHDGREALLHYTYGLNVTPDMTDMTSLDLLDLENPSSIASILKESFWKDPRHSALLGDVKTNSAPWHFGFSCALTVPTDAAKAIQGFDEQYRGWGVEDIDFCYRLYRSGVEFDTIKRLYVFHYPHPIHPSSQKVINEQKNKQYMHAKFYELESEVYTVCDTYALPPLLEKLNHLRLGDVAAAAISASQLTELNDACLRPAKRSLLVGCDSPELAGRLMTTHLFAYNKMLMHTFNKQLPERDVRYLLGCNTPFEAAEFDCTVVTDLIRMVGPDVQESMLRELARISRKIVFLLTDLEAGDWQERLNGGTPEEQTIVASPYRRRQWMERMYFSSLEDMERRIGEFCPHHAEIVILGQGKEFCVYG